VRVGGDLYKLGPATASATTSSSKATPPPPPPIPTKSAAPAAAPPAKQAAPSPAPSSPQASTPAASPKTVVSNTTAASGIREHRVKMSRMRQRISQRLKDSQNTFALLTTFNEVDMSALIAMRNTYKDEFQEKHGVKLGFMSAFVKASTAALQEQPVVNAVIEGDEIVYRDFIDVSVAVSTPTGLVVPVLRNADKLSFAAVEKTINDLGTKARNGALALEDMAGGTFTISNGGVYGSMMGTPIVNPPQSAILGMHATKDRAVVVDGQIVVRPIMYLALTYDHRLIDGREAVTFLKKIKSVIEDPRRLLLDL
jgi:2-oxoglutarate dehydrogenase E2 component (dihydrolipoamide succinyltransferase)